MNALSEETQEKLKIAAQATMMWGITNSERQATKGVRTFQEAGVEIHRFSEEDLQTIQEVTNEVMVNVACSHPDAAKVYASQLEYLQDYSDWREIATPYNLGRQIVGPDLEKIFACAQQ